MRAHHRLKLLVIIAALLVAFPAMAWDGLDLWYAPAQSMPPGGGGIVGTGGLSESSIQCVHCHIKPEQKIDAVVTSVPAFGASTAYTPGQKYQLTVKMTGEHLGFNNCPSGGMNNNGFAATFEDAAGRNVGTLASDSGQMQGPSCPQDAPKPKTLTGTTYLYDDCRVILPLTMEGATQWTFSWTAPARGTGDVTIFAGVIDGSCDMTSLNDDGKMIKLILSESSATAMQSPPSQGKGARWPLGATSAFALVMGMVVAGRKRRGE
jgi:hypothetical protein